MSKPYKRMALALLDISLEGQILTGSYTKSPIKLNEVTVDDFDNGFGDEPFKDISLE